VIFQMSSVTGAVKVNVLHVMAVYWCISLSSSNRWPGGVVWEMLGVDGERHSGAAAGLGAKAGTEACVMGDPKLTVVAGVEGDSAAEAEAAWSSARTSGCSKSHGTPCFRQLPHRGWTSSHCCRPKKGLSSVKAIKTGFSNRSTHLDFARLAPPAAGPGFLVGSTRWHNSCRLRCLCRVSAAALLLWLLSRATLPEGITGTVRPSLPALAARRFPCSLRRKTGLNGV
jgi:hypothetical protein